MIITYLIIAFIIFFFLYKSNEKELKQEYERSDCLVVETPKLNNAIFLSLIWIVSIPLMILWKILEKISKKLNLFNN